MANLTAPRDPRKADENFQQFVAWLRRDLEAHPQYQAVFARFREEVRARARDYQRTHPGTTDREARRAAILARLQEAVRAPMRGALLGLLRDEEGALKRLVAPYIPVGASEAVRHRCRAALFELAVDPEVQGEATEPVLLRLPALLRRMGDRLREAERPLAGERVVDPTVVEALALAPPAPLPAVPHILAHWCALGNATPQEAAVLQAEYDLLYEDPEHRPQLRDIAERVGVTAECAAVHRSNLRAKLRSALARRTV